MRTLTSQAFTVLCCFLCVYWFHVCLCACPCRQQATSLGSRFSWLDDLKSPTDHPFCVDCKPDQANWTYKSLYRGDIAR